MMLPKTERSGDWQPIDTAPEDDFVLVGRVGQLAAVAQRGFRIWYQPYANNPLEFVPTHWMPLPAPPPS